MGYAEDEENLKEQILALSTDERHFMRPPPGGVSYQFDYGTSYPIALATLEADPMLRVCCVEKCASLEYGLSESVVEPGTSVQGRTGKQRNTLVLNVSGYQNISGITFPHPSTNEY